MLAPKTKVKWWLEQAGFEIRRKPAFRGVRLIRSSYSVPAELAPGDLALVFAHGGGRVMHTMAHTDQDAGNLAGAVAAQRLMLNFLLMAQLERSKRPYDGMGVKK